MSRAYLLITFDSSHTAFRAEQALLELNPVMMPTLREISASCGISLRLPLHLREDAEARLKRSGLTGWQSYHVLLQGKKPVCTLTASLKSPPAP